MFKPACESAAGISCAKPAREVLFTVVQPSEKYKAKSFLDTFVYRSGDAFAAIGFEGLPAPLLALAMAAACGVWAIAGLALGRWAGDARAR